MGSGGDSSATETHPSYWTEAFHHCKWRSHTHLDHVVSLGFTVDEDVQSDLLLELDDVLDLGSDELVILLGRDLLFGELGSGLSDLLRLLWWAMVEEGKEVKAERRVKSVHELLESTRTRSGLPFNAHRTYWEGTDGGGGELGEGDLLLLGGDSVEELALAVVHLFLYGGEAVSD